MLSSHSADKKSRFIRAITVLSSTLVVVAILNFLVMPTSVQRYTPGPLLAQAPSEDTLIVVPTVLVTSNSRLSQWRSPLEEVSFEIVEIDPASQQPAYVRVSTAVEIITGVDVDPGTEFPAPDALGDSWNLGVALSAAAIEVPCLFDGLSVAATGILDNVGNVLPVGALQTKLGMVEDVDVFFVPETSLEVSKYVVKVSNVADVRQWLEDNNRADTECRHQE